MQGGASFRTLSCGIVTPLTSSKWEKRAFGKIIANGRKKRDSKIISDLLCEEAARRYRAGESIQVLSPVKTKTDFSVQALNTRLQNEVNPLTAEKQTWGAFRDGDRVIVTQNNSYYNICNGDVGVL